MESRRYALAPMSSWLALLTYALIPIPLIMLWAAFSSPPPVSLVLLGSGLFMVLIYASVWFWWRPSWFEIRGRELVMRWPLRTRTVELTSDVELLESGDFRRRYGWGMRIGAGGLWGGFGLLKTRAETFSMYISRTDRFVLLRPIGCRALMITPEDPERFVRDARSVGA